MKASMMTARVGIFWVHRGELIAVTVPVEEGADDGLFVNGPEGHAEAWERLQHEDGTLRPLEYFEVPRGRVLFDKQRHRYRVYLDKTLWTRAIKRAVIAMFSLPPARTVFGTDAHYTTCPEEIDQLFSLD